MQKIILYILLAATLRVTTLMIHGGSNVLNEMNNCDWKGKTDTNRKPFEWEKRTDEELLMNVLQSV